jgi:hypothetical protein
VGAANEASNQAFVGGENRSSVIVIRVTVGTDMDRGDLVVAGENDKIDLHTDRE